MFCVLCPLLCSAYNLKMCNMVGRGGGGGPLSKSVFSSFQTMMCFVFVQRQKNPPHSLRLNPFLVDVELAVLVITDIVDFSILCVAMTGPLYGGNSNDFTYFWTFFITDFDV